MIGFRPRGLRRNSSRGELPTRALARAKGLPRRSSRSGLPTRALARALALVALTGAASEPKHGFAFFGELKYPADMAHFDYANPAAPKGGVVRMPMIGTFNNLHPFIDKGIVAVFVDPRLAGLIYDPLLAESEDEIASYYGRLAETAAVADDLGSVTYTLRENAYWHDGKPVTVDDVLWTFETIKTHGGASWKSSYSDIVRLEQTGPRSFTFHFREAVEKTPHLVIQTGGFTPLPKHYWQDRDFGATTLEPPLGNGPYRIAAVDPGHKVALERVVDYWGRDLNVTAGYFNFDRIEAVYFFDASVMLQALRAGVLDYYRDQDESFFATAYDFEGFHQGLFKKETYQMGQSYGMHYAVVFNTRKPLFADIRVREALTLAYNFEWANRVFWHDGMARNNSYFAGSGLQARGKPTQAELDLLAPYREQLPKRVFTHPVPLPRNPAYGRNRQTLLDADRLLREAGWIVSDFERVREDTGEPLRFELVVSRGDHERMLVPFVDNLKRLGIDAPLRKIENNLMVNRLRSYDYDATVRKFYTFRIPFPNRLRGQFTSRYADLANMTNYAGIKNAVVDALVEKVAQARTEAEMNTAGRALDRVLLWNFYMIPDGHPRGRHLVYWDRFGHPTLGFPHMNWSGFPKLWWIDPAKSARVDAGISALEGG